MSLSSNRRRLLIAGGVVLLGILTLLVFVSSPYFRSRLIGSAFGVLEREYGIIGRVEQLDIDLARLDVRFSGLTLASREHPDDPFFTVDEAHIDLPWSAVWDEVSVQAVALMGPRLSVHTDTDGVSNLPIASSAETEAPSVAPRFPIGDLAVRDLTLEWLDESQNLRVDVGPMTLALSGDESRIDGPVDLTEEIVVDLDGEEVRVTALQGRLAYNGSDLSLEALRLEAPEGALTTSGEIAALLSGPTLDLTVDSSFGLDSLARRLDDDTLAGDVTLSGRVIGPVENPTAMVAVSSEGVIWDQLAVATLDGQLELTTSAARVETLTMTLAGGRASASGVLSLSDTPSRLEIEWDALDADQILDGLELDLPARLGTTLTGNLAFGWTDLDPQSSTVTLQNRGAGNGRVGNTRLESADGTYRLTIDQAFGGARIAGTVEGEAVSSNWSEISLDGQIEVDCEDLAVCRTTLVPLPDESAAADALAELGGRLGARMTIGGSVESPRVSGAITGTASGVSGLETVELSLDLAGDAVGLELSSVQVRLGDNTLRGEGGIIFESGAIRGAFDGDLTDLAAFSPLAPDGWTVPEGTVRFETDLNGTLAAPVVELVGAEGTLALIPWFEGTPDELPIRAQVDVSASGALLPDVTLDVTIATDDLRWAESEMGLATAQIAYEGDRARVSLAIARLGATGGAEVSLVGERSYSGSLSISPSGDNLSSLGAAVNLPLTGELFLDVTVVGSLDAPESMTLEAEVALADGRYGEQTVSLEPSRAIVRYTEDAVSAGEIIVGIGSSSIEITGGLTRAGTETLGVGMSGNASDLFDLVAAVPGSEAWLPELDVAGRVAFDATVTGWLDRPTVAARMDVVDGRVAVMDHPALDRLTLRGSYAEGIAEVDELSANWQGATVTGTGLVPLRLWADALPPAFVDTLPPGGAASLQIHVDSLTSDALTGYVDDDTVDQIDGLVTATLDLETDSPALASARGTLTLDDVAVALSGIPVRQRRPTRLELEDGRLRVAALDWGNEDDYLTVGGFVDLGAGPTADLTVTGSLDLVALSAFTPGAAVEGQADLIANITGSPSGLDLRGTIELSDAGVRVAEPRLIMSAVNGALLLTGQTVTPFELGGRLNGGSIDITGELTQVDLRPQGTLTLTGRQIAMNVPQGFRTELDADIGLMFEGEDITVSGTTVVQRGAYREPMSLTGGLLSAVDSRQQVRVVGLETPGPLDAVQLDIGVVTARDIVVENNYVDAAFVGDVRLGGTVGAPAVTGRVALIEGGRLQIGIRNYDIETGSIDLVDPTGIDPRVDIRARTRVSGHDITLTMSGGQDTLETSMQSDPPLPERDIVSLLLTGQTISEASGDPGFGARNQALGLVSSELLGSAGREIGLEVRITDDMTGGSRVQFDSSLIAGERDPSSQLTVGTRLSDQVQLILSQDLREGGRSWIVSYLARSNLEVSGLISEDNNRAYEFRHALDFGAPPESERFRSTMQTSQAPTRIASITFNGSTGYPADVLREQTRLRPGNVFDFHAWQDDQDRLQRFYSQRGFREARIRASRRDGTLPNEVALSYEITRGPLTRLSVLGFDLPRSVRGELEEAWALAVFEGFLLEELEAITRRHLRTRGYLQTRIQTEVITRPEQGEKAIEIRIAPGTRTETRELEFTGNEVIDTPTLTTLAAALFDEGGEWGDPTALEEALVRLYRRSGWLEATVTVDPVVFAGPLARLPVRIREGRRFAITTVDLTGVSTREPADVLRELAVPSGTEYSDEIVQEALLRLERAYRQMGFNTARVSAESTVDTDRGEVSLVVTVREGHQEMLDEIVVDGASRTHPGLVSTALDLDIGTPVDLSDWNLARIRLYDTGVFRTVDLRAEATTPERDADESAVRSMRARVLLEEWPTYNVRYGLRVNDFDASSEGGQGRDFGLGFAADMSRRNLLGRGATVGTALRAGDRGAAVRGYFRIPRTFGWPIRSGVYAELSRAQRGEEDAGFTEDLATLTFEQRLQLPLDARLTYSASFDRNHSFEEEPSNPDFPFDIRVNIMRFASNVVLDRRDSLFDATRGWFHASHVEYGFEPGGGEINFAKYLAQQYHHWSVGGSVVLASGVRIGLATGLGDPLIPTERFFAGGGNTVRGYAQDSLGPKDFFGEAEGGNALFIANQEIRFPVFWRLGAVGFVDVGNVFETAQDISLVDLAVGSGLGLRLQTPVGLLRFDYGFAVNRDEGQSSGRWHFSIGQAF